MVVSPGLRADQIAMQSDRTRVLYQRVRGGLTEGRFGLIGSDSSVIYFAQDSDGRAGK